MKRIPPPVLALAAAVGQRAVSRDARPPGAVRSATAGVTAAASFALAGSAVSRFRSSGTTVDPLDPTRASVLVTTGPNAVTRNPMYVGLTGLLVANAVRRGSWSALVPVAAFTLVVDRLQVAAEEEALLARFGPAYEAYRAVVPRWLGRRSLRLPADA